MLPSSSGLTSELLLQSCGKKEQHDCVPEDDGEVEEIDDPEKMFYPHRNPNCHELTNHDSSNLSKHHCQVGHKRVQLECPQAKRHQGGRQIEQLKTHESPA